MNIVDVVVVVGGGVCVLVCKRNIKENIIIFNTKPDLHRVVVNTFRIIPNSFNV